MEVNIGVVVVTKHKLVRGGGGCKTKVGEREREREREILSYTKHLKLEKIFYIETRVF